MKDKQAACLVLIILIAVMAFGTQKVFQRMSDAKNIAKEKKAAASQAEMLFRKSQLDLSRMKTDTKELREFHTAWEPYMEATKNWLATEDRIVVSSRAADIFAHELRFEKLDNKDDPMVKQILRAHMDLDDEYSKVFNWFGEIEQSFPTARV
ncbi:MAG: hypothetical protein AAF585_20435, partial [Verrucomicrobiota bacterium]